jgi:hypothetical protein
LVESDGALNEENLNVFFATCDAFRDGLKVCADSQARGRKWGVRCEQGGPKYVFAGNIPLHHQSRYNFETGIWSNDLGEKYKNGKLVE